MQEERIQPAYQRSTKVWFDDGNVAFRAQNTVFRVFKGILSKESPVFRDMFSLPQPENIAGLDEELGCPVVEVQDEVEEMELFLTAMFVPCSFNDEFEIREHILLLGICSKYQTIRILRQVVSTLEHIYPSTLHDYDHSTSGSHPVCGEIWPQYPLRNAWHDEYEARRLVLVGRKAGLLVLLPVALLCLSENSTLQIVSELYEGWSREDIQMLLKGKQILDAVARDEIFRPLYSSRRNISEECSANLECHALRHQIISNITCVDNDDVWEILPFYPLYFDTGPPSLLCASCKEELRTSYLAGRAMAWSKLPGYFGLPSWAELRKARNDFLRSS